MMSCSPTQPAIIKFRYNSGYSIVICTLHKFQFTTPFLIQPCVIRISKSHVRCNAINLGMPLFMYKKVLAS